MSRKSQPPSAASSKGPCHDRPLQGQNVLVVGWGSGLARAAVLAARDAGATVVAAGRQQEALDAAYAGEPGVTTQFRGSDR
jgi:NAD(P)-dependent dehydrogenase (short-subunit alcohol dehydrogenase family)